MLIQKGCIFSNSMRTGHPVVLECLPVINVPSSVTGQLHFKSTILTSAVLHNSTFNQKSLKYFNQTLTFCNYWLFISYLCNTAFNKNIINKDSEGWIWTSDPWVSAKTVVLIWAQWGLQTPLLRSNVLKTPALLKSFSFVVLCCIIQLLIKNR